MFQGLARRTGGRLVNTEHRVVGIRPLSSSKEARGALPDGRPQTPSGDPAASGDLIR